MKKNLFFLFRWLFFSIFAFEITPSDEVCQATIHATHCQRHTPLVIHLPLRVGEAAIEVPEALPATVDDFPLRAYHRTDLAEQYHPESHGKSAWEKFKYELDLCHGLHNALRDVGYDGKRRTYTPTEVWVIAQFLDTP